MTGGAGPCSRGARCRRRAVLLAATLMALVPQPLPVQETDPAGVRGTVLSAVLGLRPPVADAPSADRVTTALWGWPLLGTPEVVGAYDPPAQRWLPGHRGIDLEGVVGEPVLAVDDGVVSYSGQVAGVGVVSVTHADGLRSTYQPVRDRVPRFTRVGRGDRLGDLDVGGHCVLSGCLHLGARRGDVYVDPTPLLLELELSLLPLGGS